MTRPNEIQRGLLKGMGLLLMACLVGLPSRLYSMTLKFTSGATFEGVILGFKGTNTVVMGSPKDGKHYAVALSSLDKDSRWQVTTFGQLARAFRAEEPRRKDASWLSNQEQLYTLKAKALLVERKRKLAGDTAELRRTAKRSDAAEQRQFNGLSKDLVDLNSRIAGYEAKQKEIVAKYRLRELKL